MIPLELGLEAGVKLIELAAEIAPKVIDLIKSSGELSDEQKALLRARVDAARAKVSAYEPRDV